MRDHVIMYVNGQRHAVRGARAFQSLSDFLRYDLGLIGTKVVCAEGDCGSCTVFIGRRAGDKIEYHTACSCIQFLYQLDCTHIITVEGLKYSGELNPIQEAMVTCQGSQCGFCTPGFVVSMYAMFEERLQRATEICSTGFQPVPNFSTPAEHGLKNRATAHDVQHACVGNLCRCTGYQSILQAGASVEPSQIKPLADLFPADEMLSDFEQGQAESVTVRDGDKLFCKPVSLAEACAFRRDNPSCTIIAGGTDIGVQLNKALRDPKIFLSLSGLNELRTVRVADGRIIAGALVSIGELERVCRTALPEYSRLLYYFGSPPIKNAGTIGGNIANGSPIGDSMPAMYVLNAEVELTGTSGSRRVNINEFYTGYRANVAAADELVSAVHIPLPAANDIFKLYKISKRKDLDISAFTAAIWMRKAGDTIAEARIAYGGVGPNIIRLRRTEAFLTGKSLSEEVMREAGKIARGEITPISDVRGSADFRSQLAENILRKFFAELDEQDHSGNGHDGDGNGNGDGDHDGRLQTRGARASV